MKKLIIGLVSAIIMVACGDDSSNNAYEGGASINSEGGCSSCEYGKLTDDRDGQTYRTVKIGSQTWMAVNLNYAYTQRTDDLDSSSVCLENNPDYCKKYGRFYLWSAAMDSAGLFSKSGLGCGYHADCGAVGNVQGVCPTGWHLPSESDYETMFAAVGGFGGRKSIGMGNSDGENEWHSVGAKLFSTSNQYGFDAIPAGYIVLCTSKEVPSDAAECLTSFFTTQQSEDYTSNYKDISNEGNKVRLWTSTSRLIDAIYEAYSVTLRLYGDKAMIGEASKGESLLPVRCVKD
jgi:uncharacterized protein (TIGR02145 family)